MCRVIQIRNLSTVLKNEEKPARIRNRKLVGFGPTPGHTIGLQVQHLNHSAIWAMADNGNFLHINLQIGGVENQILNKLNRIQY